MLGEASVTPADVAGRVVVVIDVLRAATTVATALQHGARAVYPFETVEETARRAAELDRDSVRLAGERRMVRVPGFDFGNSPLEFTQGAVSGLTVLCSTTNGTRALVAARSARHCFFSAFVNVSATIAAVQQSLASGQGDVTIVCAGNDGKVALEDVVCAGRIVRALLGTTEAVIGDGARIAVRTEGEYDASIAALAVDATHARALTAAGFEADVAYCLALDSVPVAVSFLSHQLQLHPELP